MCVNTSRSSNNRKFDPLKVGTMEHATQGVPIGVTAITGQHSLLPKPALRESRNSRN